MIVKRDSRSCHLSLQLGIKKARRKRERAREKESERKGECVGRSAREVNTRSKEEIEDLYGSLTFRTVHVSDPVSQLFLRQRFVYVPEVSNGHL